MNKKAFTLIEILVIITIIGIISAVIFVISNSAISSTQNARIKHDIDSLRKVILSYKAYYRLAPVEDPACNVGSNCSQLASDLLAIDPNISFPTNPSGGYYRYYSANGTTFTITADLPNSRTLVYDFQNGYSEYTGLAGYSKRKSITVSNSGSTLTNYQMKFTVYRSAGTDSGFNVYLGTNCQADYDDIRFTNSSNTVLDYWIESSDASSATIWVEADSLGSGDTTMYLYYANASATAVSSGDNTFVFFDDFSGTSIDTDKWDVFNSISISNGILTVGPGTVWGTWHGVQSDVSSFVEGTIIRTKIKSSRIGIFSNSNVRIIDAADGSNEHILHGTTVNINPTPTVENYNGSSSYVAQSGISADTWCIVEMKKYASGIKVTIDDGNLTTNTVRYTSGAKKIRHYLTSNTSADSISVDWTALHKYTATEPTVSWGTEESL